MFSELEKEAITKVVKNEFTNSQHAGENTMSQESFENHDVTNFTTSQSVETVEETKRGRGRPKGKATKPNTCKKCGGVGHNSRTCKFGVTAQVSENVEVVKLDIINFID